MTITVYTVGHSTRMIVKFIALLESVAVQTVIDVRTIAKSRHNPQYGEVELGASLSAVGIAYRRMPGLGGLRHTTSSSINQAWENRSFRGYADYMQTTEFTDSLHELIRIAETTRIVIMCAEIVPWRCHRSLIGDALTVRGIRVIDLIDIGKPRAHQLTSFAHVDGHTITYPATEEP